MTTTIGTLSEFVLQKEKISTYLECVELYFAANEVEDEKHVPVLLTAIGGETYALLCSLLAPVKPSSKTFTELKEVLQRHFNPKRLVIAERFYFHSRSQASGKSITEYVSEIRRLATNCEIGEYLEQTLRNTLVYSLNMNQHRNVCCRNQCYPWQKQSNLLSLWKP